MRANPGEKPLGLKGLVTESSAPSSSNRTLSFHLGIALRTTIGTEAASALNFPAEIFAGHSRKLQIRTHRAGKLFAEKFQTGGAIGSDLYLKRVGFEEPLSVRCMARLSSTTRTVSTDIEIEPPGKRPFVRPRRPQVDALIVLIMITLSGRLTIMNALGPASPGGALCTLPLPTNCSGKPDQVPKMDPGAMGRFD